MTPIQQQTSSQSASSSKTSRLRSGTISSQTSSLDQLSFMKMTAKKSVQVSSKRKSGYAPSSKSRHPSTKGKQYITQSKPPSKKNSTTKTVNSRANPQAKSSKQVNDTTLDRTNTNDLSYVPEGLLFGFFV